MCGRSNCISGLFYRLDVLLLAIPLVLEGYIAICVVCFVGRNGQLDGAPYLGYRSGDRVVHAVDPGLHGYRHGEVSFQGYVVRTTFLRNSLRDGRLYRDIIRGLRTASGGYFHPIVLGRFVFETYRARSIMRIFGDLQDGLLGRGRRRSRHDLLLLSFHSRQHGAYQYGIDHFSG